VDKVLYTVTHNVNVLTVQYSHMYVTTPCIQQFLRDQQLQERCQAYVALSGI